MSIAELFIRRPVMTTLVMFAILLFGIMGYRSLPVSDLPNVDFPTINVGAGLPGASPETMASSVALPLEKQFSTIAGLSSMSSSSSQGSTSVTLQFDLSRNIDSAAQDVEAAINSATGRLPAGMPSPPTYRKQNPADQPILFLAVSSSTLPIYQVDEYAENLLAQRISMVTGVAEVGVFGSATYAVRIQLNPLKMAALKIGINEVASAIQAANANVPTGTLWGQNTSYTVQATGQLNTASAYGPIIVAYRNGAPVRLEELGKVLDSIQNDKTISWFNTAKYNNQRAVILSVQRQPGTNTVEVVNNIQAVLPQLEYAIPPSVHIDTLYDRSQDIRSSVNEVKLTLWLAVCLVVLVIFLFLRNLSATLIPSLALPMSIVGTFAVMYELGYTLDNLSLMALTLSVGFVVDDAIVMLENIVRHMEMGEPPMQAALRGSREIGFTILSMTLSLIAVFIPVLFMGGIIGRLLHEFSVVIMMAVAVSGFVSLTLTPMLCSRFLRAEREGRAHGRVYQATQRGFDAMLGGYERSLRWCLSHRLLTISLAGVMLAIVAWQFIAIPKGFIPSGDSGAISVYDEAVQGVSFQLLERYQRQLNKIVIADPNVGQFFSVAGGGFMGGSNTGHLFAHLKPDSERAWSKSRTYDSLLARAAGHPFLQGLVRDLHPVFAHHLSTDEVMAELRPKVGSIPGIRVYLQNPPPLNIGGHMAKSQYQFALSSPDTAALYQYAPILEADMRKLPGIIEVTTDLQMHNPQAEVSIDRNKASALGLSATAIEDALYTAYGSPRVSTIYAPNNEYWVETELEPKFQDDPQALSLLYISSSSGQLVPLDTVATIRRTYGPLTVNHIGQSPAVTLSFDLAPGVALGQGVSEVQDLAKRVLPPSITGSFQGTAQAFQGSLSTLGILLIVTVLVIYIILGILYESFIHPLTILSGLPAAAFGGLLTLMVFGSQLDLYGFVGLIMLIGIVKKNAIMMIDFALAAQRNESKPPIEAIYQGAVIRFRPIMMTTMAAIMGTLPIALGWGAGSDTRRPLGEVVVGGLILAQIVTLYLTPVFYLYMESAVNLVRRLRRQPVPELVPAHAGFGNNGGNGGEAVLAHGGVGDSERRDR